MFVYGKNDYGQCGVPSSSRNVLAAPAKLDPHRDFIPALGDSIVDAATGENHTLLVTSSGVLYVAGTNTAGQCGVADTPHLFPFRRVDDAAFVKEHDAVVSVSCGATFSLVLTESGKRACAKHARADVSVCDGLNSARATGHRCIRHTKPVRRACGSRLAHDAK